MRQGVVLNGASFSQVGVTRGVSKCQFLFQLFAKCSLFSNSILFVYVHIELGNKRTNLTRIGYIFGWTDNG